MIKKEELQELAEVENRTDEQEKKIQLLRGLVTFSMVLHEYVHFADWALDGMMIDTDNFEFGEYFEFIKEGGYWEIINGKVVLIIPPTIPSLPPITPHH